MIGGAIVFFAPGAKSTSQRQGMRTQSSCAAVNPDRQNDQYRGDADRDTYGDLSAGRKILSSHLSDVAVSNRCRVAGLQIRKDERLFTGGLDIASEQRLVAELDGYTSAFADPERREFLFDLRCQSCVLLGS